MSKLFSKITELLEEPDVLVFVLIDEIESLAAARKVGREGFIIRSPLQAHL